jgi:hypothetical protein
VDTWACGVLLYELLRGDVPWRHSNLGQYNGWVDDIDQHRRATGKAFNVNIPGLKGAVPPALRGILTGLLKTDPGHRISLGEVLTNPRIFAPPPVEATTDDLVGAEHLFEYTPYRATRKKPRRRRKSPPGSSGSYGSCSSDSESCGSSSGGGPCDCPKCREEANKRSPCRCSSCMENRS